MTVNVQIDEIKDMYTLTLKGNALINDGIDNADVWTSDDPSTAVPGTENGAYGTNESITYQIPEGAQVTIKDNDGLDTNGRFQLADGVFGIVNNKTLTFTMTKNVTVDDDQLIPANALVAATFAEGLTPDADSWSVKPAAQDGNVYYVQTGANVDVDSNGAKFMWATDKDNVSCGADIWFYPAIGVTAATDVKATYDKAGTATDIGDAKIAVALDTDLTVAPASAADGSGVILDVTGSTKVGKEIISYKVTGTADVTLIGAFEVTLNNVTAQVSGVNLTSGDFVKKGENITSVAAVPGTGNTVIDATGGKVFGADITTSGVVSLAKDVTLSAATEITLKANSGLEVMLKNTSGEEGTDPTIARASTSDVKISVLAGQTIIVVNADNGPEEIKITDGTNPITEGVTTNPVNPGWLSYVVDTTPVTLDD